MQSKVFTSTQKGNINHQSNRHPRFSSGFYLSVKIYYDENTSLVLVLLLIQKSNKLEEKAIQLDLKLIPRYIGSIAVPNELWNESAHLTNSDVDLGGPTALWTLKDEVPGLIPYRTNLGNVLFTLSGCFG